MPIPSDGQVCQACVEPMIGPEFDEFDGCHGVGVLSPCQRWLTEWRARRDVPEAPPYPRFHPLPTRPMFQTAPVAAPLRDADPYGFGEPGY